MALAAFTRSIAITKAVAPFVKYNPVMAEKNNLLDPLSVIITMAINSYKPVGTKLYVHDCYITLHDISVFQAPMRTLYGDSKLNIKVLHYPILYACKYYLKRMSESNGIMLLFIRAKKGLENLRHTYKDDLETRTIINSYINIINSAIENKQDAMDLLDKLIKLNISEEDTESMAPDGGSRSSGGSGSRTTVHYIVEIKNHIFDELNKSWDSNKIGLVVALIRELETCTPTTVGFLFTSLDAFMRSIHEKTLRIVDSLFAQK
jgi:hypothetical protein